RIEVGYGLEGLLPDGRCGSIIRGVMGPDLAADRFGPGLLRGADAIAGIIARDRGVALAGGRGATQPAEPARGGHPLLPLAILFVVLLLLSWLMRRASGGWGDWRGRRRWSGPFGGGFGSWGGFGGSFGGHGGGFGGGFGGFGGGRSGGGGASGRF
ncbi:MAG TPA: TPM domain-containing protein, partial [Candidatus Eisenbacteria bacterium]